MSDIFYSQLTNSDVPLVHLEQLDNPGIYLNWERRNPSTLEYRIERSRQFDAPNASWETVETVEYPVNEYTDQTGDPHYYYRIVERIDDPLNPGTTIDGHVSQPMIGEGLLIKQSLVYELRDWLRIPVIEEEGVMNRDRTQAYFAYHNWNYYPRPIIKINGNPIDAGTGDVVADPMAELSEEDYLPAENINLGASTTVNSEYPDELKYKINYQGKAFFFRGTDGSAYPIHEYNQVTASYFVRFFTVTEMNDALNLAFKQITGQAGAPKYTNISAVPIYWDPYIIAGAMWWLLRRATVRLIQKETKLLLLDEEMNLDAVRETAKMYKEEFDEGLKSIPRAFYPSTRGIVVPEYYMPGGRSRYFRYIWKSGA